MPKYCKIKIYEMSVDNYYHTEHKKIFYIKFKMTISDKKNKLIYDVYFESGFFLILIILVEVGFLITTRLLLIQSHKI